MFSIHKQACTFLLALCLLTLCNSLAAATDISSTRISSTRISGNIALELNAYADEGQFTHQDYHYNTSLAVKPEFYWQWNDSNDSIIFTPLSVQISKMINVLTEIFANLRGHMSTATGKFTQVFVKFFGVSPNLIIQLTSLTKLTALMPLMAKKNWVRP